MTSMTGDGPVRGLSHRRDGKHNLRCTRRRQQLQGPDATQAFPYQIA